MQFFPSFSRGCLVFGCIIFMNLAYLGGFLSFSALALNGLFIVHHVPSLPSGVFSCADGVEFGIYF